MDPIKASFSKRPSNDEMNTDSITCASLLAGATEGLIHIFSRVCPRPVSSLLPEFGIEYSLPCCPLSLLLTRERQEEASLESYSLPPSQLASYSMLLQSHDSFHIQDISLSF